MKRKEAIRYLESGALVCGEKRQALYLGTLIKIRNARHGWRGWMVVHGVIAPEPPAEPDRNRELALPPHNYRVPLTPNGYRRGYRTGEGIQIAPAKLHPAPAGWIGVDLPSYLNAAETTGASIIPHLEASRPTKTARREGRRVRGLLLDLLEHEQSRYSEADRATARSTARRLSRLLGKPFPEAVARPFRLNPWSELQATGAEAPKPDGGRTLGPLEVTQEFADALFEVPPEEPTRPQLPAPGPPPEPLPPPPRKQPGDAQRKAKEEALLGFFKKTRSALKVVEREPLVVVTFRLKGMHLEAKGATLLEALESATDLRNQMIDMLAAHGEL